MNNLVWQSIRNNDIESLRHLLAENPRLANEGIPYDEKNLTKAAPLHRICDAVFSGRLSEKDAVVMAGVFLDAGAVVDGTGLAENQDTPLIAASSLNADQLAFLYLEKGADIYRAGTHGGTALHWAAWTGRPALIKKLLQLGAEINRKCKDFKSTPLFWAVHGLKSSNGSNLPAYKECIKLLIQAGADENIPNLEGVTIFDLAREMKLDLFD